MSEISFELEGKKYQIRKPSSDDMIKAKAIYNRFFNEAIKVGCPLRATASKILREQGLWNDDKQNELNELYKKIEENELVLSKGGIRASKAREICLKVKSLREEVQNLLIPMTDFNRHTAEGQAENGQFDYFVSCCLVNEDGSPVFKTYEEYVEKGATAIGILGAQKFADYYYGIQEDFQGSLLENKVLKQLKFIDEQYRLVDNKGRLINEEGQLVNELGQRIDENGVLINSFGHKVDENGDFLVEFKPFLDDNGNPIGADSQKQDSAQS